MARCKDMVTHRMFSDVQLGVGGEGGQSFTTLVAMSVRYVAVLTLGQKYGEAWHAVITSST